jgi:predicted nucleic-acid-binding Zn-ribbon protein
MDRLGIPIEEIEENGLADTCSKCGAKDACTQLFLTGKKAAPLVEQQAERYVLVRLSLGD